MIIKKLNNFSLSWQTVPGWWLLQQQQFRGTPWRWRQLAGGWGFQLHRGWRFPPPSTSSRQPRWYRTQVYSPSAFQNNNQWYLIYDETLIYFFCMHSIVNLRSLCRVTCSSLRISKYLLVHGFSLVMYITFVSSISGFI